LFPRHVPPPLPWARPRYELLLLALVAVAALSPIHALAAPDVSRICLTRSLVQLRVSADACLESVSALDQATHDGHFFSDKAPGMSVLEIPAVEAVRLPPPTMWPQASLRLWAVRLSSSGILFLLCAFLVGRVSEGIAPGFGGWSLVAFALGTLAAPFSAANFDHVPVAALGFGAFLLVWRRRPLLAGLAAGAALACEYEAALPVLIVGAYAMAAGWRPLGRYACGVLPGAALLGAYDWAAFGAPWHASYRYVSNQYASEQASGFFGIGLPRWHAVYDVFIGNEGLVLISPIVVAAGAGLFLLARRFRAEAVVCAAVTGAFLFLNCGYFLPYGGLSPGPRFVIPALPFLALGLGPAFARLPKTTGLSAVLSVVSMTTLTLTWAAGPHYRETVWGELIRVPAQGGSSRLAKSLAANALSRIGPGREGAALLVALSAAAAVGVAAASRRGTREAPA
jgi:hypothetical protein